MRKKKSRARHGLPPAEVNVISLMDVLTTLLFFILMVSSFSKFSIMDAVPLSMGKGSDDKKNVFALEVRIKGEKSAEIWLGPIDGLKLSQEGDFNRYLKRYFSGSSKQGYSKKLWAKDKDKLVAEIRKYLQGIKKGFPHENRVVVSFVDQIKYQDMITTMGAVREIASNDQAFEIVNFIDKKEKTRVLFPQVVFSEGK